MNVKEVIKLLESNANPENAAGMEHFGIVTKKSFGITAPELHKIAKEIKKSASDRHKLALELWNTEIYDARIIAALIDDPKQATEEQLESWTKDFDNWAVCDTCCCYLFDKTPFAYKKASEWSGRKQEFVKRAGFALMAYLAIHDKKAPDDKFLEFLPLIERESDDDRNFVRKAVNWSLRQIGKRSLNLHQPAVKTAEKIKKRDTKAARWIASDALRELNNPKTTERLKNKKK